MALSVVCFVPRVAYFVNGVAYIICIWDDVLPIWECVFGIFDGVFRISDCVFYQQASGRPDPLALHQDLAPGSASNTPPPTPP